MSVPMHVYRISDLMDRLYRSAEPLLVFPCKTQCHVVSGCRHCVHQDRFDPLVDLPLPIVTVHMEDLHQIPLRGYEASWGRALLVYQGQVIHQWPQLPSRAEVQATLETLDVSLQKPRT